MPFKGGGNDEIYLQLMDAGAKAVPCLIESISDTTPMPDPRMAPEFGSVVVGDVAVFMLSRITGIEFETFLPQQVRSAYQEQGVYAYFEYVADPLNRAELQRRWRGWWSSQRSTSPHH